MRRRRLIEHETAFLRRGAREMLGFPHLVLWPSLTFALTLLAFTFIGDGLGGVYGKDR